jgi:hypothetical protein
MTAICEIVSLSRLLPVPTPLSNAVIPVVGFASAAPNGIGPRSSMPITSGVVMASPTGRIVTSTFFASDVLIIPLVEPSIRIALTTTCIVPLKSWGGLTTRSTKSFCGIRKNPLTSFDCSWPPEKNCVPGGKDERDIS